MASFVAYQAFDYKKFLFEIDQIDAEVAVKTTSKFALKGSFVGHVYLVEVVGSEFTYDQWGLNTGKVSTITYKKDGIVQWSVSPGADWDLSNNVYDSGYGGYWGQQAELAYMAKGNDSWIGSSASDSARGFEGDDVLNGMAGDDVLYGDSGSDTLDGGDGADLMFGGAGNDRYIVGVGNGSDTITDGAGTDALELRVTQYAGFEIYRSGSDLKIRGSGSDLTTVKNFTTTGYIESLEYKKTDAGATGNYVIAKGATGTSGNDWVAGTTTSDTLEGGAGNDVLQGDAGNDTLNAGDGSDTLIGGGGNDSLNGGAGSDRYVIGVGNGSDTITDSAGTDVLELRVTQYEGFGFYRSGFDLKIRGSVSDLTTVKNFTTTGYIEFLEYKKIDAGATGTYAIAKGATGTSGNDWVAGTTSSDTLEGGAGNDVLQGDAGNDTLNAGDGSDTLIGGGGNDSLNGGAGNDRYIIGIGNGPDTITDSAGTDVLELRAPQYAGLGLYRSGTDLKIRGSGSELATVKNFTTTGYIESLEYKKTDAGSTGTYVIAKAATGTSGNDWVAGTTGSDTLEGGAGNDVLQGDAGNDNLQGGLGNDVINGGSGNDTLIGGQGKDVFAFTSTPNSGSNVDKIQDFTIGEDLLRFESTVFGELGSPGALQSSAFWKGVGVSQGHDSDDRILYDTSSGKLYYDADGGGSIAAVQVALIGTSTHVNLDYKDFLIV